MYKIWACKLCGGRLDTGFRCMKCGVVHQAEPIRAGNSTDCYLYGSIKVTEEQAIKYLKDLGYTVIKGGEKNDN